MGLTTVQRDCAACETLDEALTTVLRMEAYTTEVDSGVDGDCNDGSRKRVRIFRHGKELVCHALRNGNVCFRPETIPLLSLRPTFSS